MRWLFRLLIVGLLSPAACLAQPDGGAETLDAETLDELVDRLGHPVYAQRRDAQRRLLSRGLSAFDALRAGRDRDDPEIAEASRALLAELTTDWIRGGETGRVRSILEAYSEATTADERDRLISLLRTRVEGVDALLRIARFDPSDRAAREAAHALLASQLTTADEIALSRGRLLIAGVGNHVDPRFAEALIEANSRATERYGAGRRPTAQWAALMADELSGRAAPADWREQAERENRVLRAGRDATRVEIVAALWRRGLHSALRVDDAESAAEALRRLVDLLPDDAETEFVKALRAAIDARAFASAERFLDRHPDRLGGKRVLYALAELELVQDRPEAAQGFADRAVDAPETVTADSPEDFAYWARVAAANELVWRGHDAWAEREFRVVFEGAEPLDESALVARWEFAESLFEAARYPEAADVLRPLVEAADKAGESYGELTAVENDAAPGPGFLRTRGAFLEGLAANARGDQEAEIRALQKAWDSDPSDADILIAMHRVEDPPAAFAEQTRERIERLKNRLQNKVWASLGSRERVVRAEALNHWAWLVGNTTGDYQKAVRYSRRSLRILPETAGFLDTLGRCLFSAGDIEGAIRAQSRAVELDPRSKVLLRQLDEFVAARDAASGAEGVTE